MAFYLDFRAQEKDGVLEVKIDVEMSLDEWKALQEVSRPRVEFNIRKAEDKIPTKAKVIHQSRQHEVRNLKFAAERSFQCFQLELG